VRVATVSHQAKGSRLLWTWNRVYVQRGVTESQREGARERQNRGEGTPA
jgi:hypothetical protein